MQRSRFARWPLHRGRSLLSREPGAVLFRGLRINLTLWYCGVMAAALVLFSVALYLSTQQFLVPPIKDDTARPAHAHLTQLLAGSPNACPSFGPPGQFGPPSDQGFVMSEMIACYDQNGNLLSNTAGLPTAFLSNNLAKTALRTGQPADDVVNAGGTYGQTYRYAVVVPNSSGNVSVIVAGESIQQQENALSVLLKLLLAFGGVALLGAGVGGLFLSNRADAEVLLRSHGQLEEEDAMLLEDIVAETKHMSNLASNLLTLARLDNSTSHREHEVVNLAEIARAGARRIQALADQAEITIQLASNEAVLVIGDPMLLEQAVLALLDNAIKYNRRGGQVVVRTAVQQGQALLEVRDTGIGIAAEHLPHLGERFYRLDKARSRQAVGTGLGLSIPRCIAITH